eukprot:gnl/Trimastix_PCT/268.p1 GENE.gnl/Trimastix_PCT/268~~gnl/Trimastix_PCT/268.p1  ORF type:complete len:1139 (+),score=392.01 gnl/Trimastix_PCT/268:95-3418(+)
MQHTCLSVYFVDNSCKKILLTPDMLVRDLIDKVAKKIPLTVEKESFGIYQKIRDQENYLSPDSPVSVPPANAKLIFKRRYFYTDDENNDELLHLNFIQARQEVLDGNYQVGIPDILKLAALNMRITYGQHDPTKHSNGFLLKSLANFVPFHVRRSKKDQQWEKEILQEFARLDLGETIVDQKQARQRYLSHLKQALLSDGDYYGSVFFPGLKYEIVESAIRSKTRCTLAVNKNGIFTFLQTRPQRTLAQHHAFTNILGWAVHPATSTFIYTSQAPKDDDSQSGDIRYTYESKQAQEIPVVCQTYVDMIIRSMDQEAPAAAAEEEEAEAEAETAAVAEEAEEEADEEAEEEEEEEEEEEDTSGMRKLINIVNKLQDAFAKVNMTPIDLPQIAVVGCQSSGKSSVLENVVGRDFLPRGCGIVTRRPLVLQLIHTNEGAEYGVFLHNPMRKFYDFDEIRREIERDTDRVTGTNKGVSHMPINLKVYSPHVVDLTLIDLPGLTKLPVGDQPKDIDMQIRQMVLSFVERPNCIILAVTPANSDLANSDSLELAQDVDPQGKRTIGVLTKLDLMDEGTDCLDILEGRVVPMRFIGVVNRSQKDIEGKKDIFTALQKERDFFECHPAYRSVSNMMGTPYLARTLNRALVNHIRTCLPEIRQNVEKKLREAERELALLGGDDSDMKRKQVAFGALSGFSRCFGNLIDGAAREFDDLRIANLAVELIGGAKIKSHFTKTLIMDIESIDIDLQLTNDVIQHYIQNATGAKSLMNIPEEAFVWAIKLGVGQLLNPCLKCVSDVFNELVQVVQQTADKVEEFGPFPALKERIVEVASGLVNRFVQPTNELVTKMVEMELAYINLENPTVQVKEIKKTERHEMLEGFLVKKGGDKWNIARVTKEVKWQRRWFVLKSRTLFYFSDPESTKPLGVIPLDGCLVQPWMDYQLTDEERAKLNEDGAEPVDYTQPDHLEFRVIHSSGRVILHNRNSLEMRSENKEEYDVWLEAMRRACGMTIDDDSETKQSDVSVLREVVLSYYRSVRLNLYDTVPKAVMYSLVNPTKKTMEKELMVRVYDEDLLDSIMAEDPQARERRLRVKRTVQLLQEVHFILQEVSDGKVG